MRRPRAALLLAALALLILAGAAEADRLRGAFRGYINCGNPAGDGFWWTPDGPGPAGPPLRRGAVTDIYAFWPYWFEHNKEHLLAERIGELRTWARHPPQSSVAYFREGAKASQPVTGVQKQEIVLPLLAAALEHPNPWVRDAAIIALGKLGGGDVVPLLVRHLEDPDHDLREDALLALGLTRQPAALAPLLEVVAGRDRNQAAFAALGLALHGDPAARGPLLAAFDRLAKAGDTEAAGCAFLGLATIADPSDVARSASKLAGGAALSDSAARGRMDLDGHRRVLPDRELDPLRVWVAHALGRLPSSPRVLRVLIRFLTSKSSAVRASAAAALGTFVQPEVIRYLRGKDGLKSGDRMVKLFSMTSLARIGAVLDASNPDRISILKEFRKLAEKPQKDKYSAMFAALQLGLMGDRSANEYFVEMLAYDNRSKYAAEIHSAMAMAMGLSGDRRSDTDLLEIVSRKFYEPDYRGYSAFSLGLLRAGKTRGTLRDTLRGTRVRPELLRSGCWAIALMGDRSDVEWLLRVLDRNEEKSHHARGAAAIAIGLLGDGSSLDAIVEVAKTAEDPTTRAFAIAAIGWLVDKEDVPRIPLLFTHFHYRQSSLILRKVMSTL